MERAAQVLTYNDQARVILERAEAKGIEHTFMFTTTFRRYVELIEHMDDLQRAIVDEGLMVSKEYVKGRKNLYVNPAVNAYNTTAAQANNTAKILIKLIEDTAAPKDSSDGFEIF